MEALNKCCPNCSGELEREKKSFLGFTHWIICTDCGYRETDVEAFLEEEDELPPVHIQVQEMTLNEVKEYMGNDWDGVDYKPIYQDESGRF